MDDNLNNIEDNLDNTESKLDSDEASKIAETMSELYTSNASIPKMLNVMKEIQLSNERIFNNAIKETVMEHFHQHGGFGSIEFDRRPITYFFKGGSYVAYNWDTNDYEYPNLISSKWKITDSFTSNLDCALPGQGKYAGKLYFFKGNEYVRWNNRSNQQEDKLVINKGWDKLPPAFHNKLDAAVNGEGKFSGKALFFKGGSFVAYNWATDTYDAPKQIIEGFDLYDDDFKSDIQCVASGAGKSTGKVYFFKGANYIRCDWKTGNMDLGYPKPIYGNWGLPAIPHKSGSGLNKIFHPIFTSDLDCAFFRDLTFDITFRP